MRLPVLALALLCLPGLALAEDADAVFERVAAAYADVAALDMGFTQTSDGPAYFEPVVQTGRLRLELPGKLRWEFHGKSGSVEKAWVSDGSRLWVLDEGNRTAQQFDGVDAQLKRYFSLFTGLRELRQDYRASWSDGVLTLTPKGPDDQIASIALAVSDAGQVSTVTVRTPLGDSTRLELADVRRVKDLDDALFTWTKAAGWELLPPM